MPRWSGSARHVPAAPALVERDAVCDRELLRAARQHPRDTGRRKRIVAGQAVVAALEVRLPHKRLLERGEDDAPHRILGGQLDETAPHPADRAALVEEKG